MVTKEAIYERLSSVQDPEIHMNIVELGLVYDAEISDNGTVHLRMTLTSPACPYGPMLVGQVRQALQSLAEVTQAVVEVVWTPPWDPRTMASEDVKIQLGLVDNLDLGGPTENESDMR